MILFDVLETKSTRNSVVLENICYMCLCTHSAKAEASYLKWIYFPYFSRLSKVRGEGTFEIIFFISQAHRFKQNKNNRKKQAPRNCVSVAYNLNLLLFNIRTPPHLFCSSCITFY